jgi:fermentation-respiration switch protein FrsA (DUF1100 family)
MGARIKRFIITFLSVFIVVFVLLMLFAQNLFYYPERGTSKYTPKDFGLSYENVTFSSLDGTKLHGWFIHSYGKAKGTVVHVHGNAGKLENHLSSVYWLAKEDYNILTFDYRGYGLSDDKKPTPKALMEDTKSAIAYVKSRADVDPNKILSLAQSIGGNNAIAAVGSGQRSGVRAIVVDSTFFSYKTIANDKFFAGGLFVSDEYSASRFVKNIAPIPTLFIHGTGDEIISYEHSEKLYELASHPKKLIIVPHARHISILQNKIYQNEVLRFFDESLKTK